MEIVDHGNSMRGWRMIMMIQLVKLVDLKLVVPIRRCCHLEIHVCVCVLRVGMYSRIPECFKRTFLQCLSITAIQNRTSFELTI